MYTLLSKCSILEAGNCQTIGVHVYSSYLQHSSRCLVFSVCVCGLRVRVRV